MIINQIRLMKTFILSIIYICIFTSIGAQPQIIVQTGEDATLYNSLNEAVTQAPDGATIYLPGGDIPIDEKRLIINRKLHLIGAGHYPMYTQGTGRTVIFYPAIQSQEADIVFAPGSDNSIVEGIYLTGQISVAYEDHYPEITGIQILRSNVETLDFNSKFVNVDFTKANKILAKECVIRDDIRGAGIEQLLVMNSFIHGELSDLKGQKIVFENNIMLVGLYNEVTEVVFNNNIFGRPFPSPSSNIGINNHFRHNMLALSQFPCCIGTNENNIFNVSYDDQFVFVNTPSFSSPVFNYFFDFHLKDSSVGKGTGLNGTDIGIYGGVAPYKEGAVPSNPHIVSKYISPQTDANGNLKIDITVEAQKN